MYDVIPIIHEYLSFQRLNKWTDHFVIFSKIQKYSPME